MEDYANNKLPLIVLYATNHVVHYTNKDGNLKLMMNTSKAQGEEKPLEHVLF